MVLHSQQHSAVECEESLAYHRQASRWGHLALAHKGWAAAHLQGRFCCHRTTTQSHPASMIGLLQLGWVVLQSNRWHIKISTSRTIVVKSAKDRVCHASAAATVTQALQYPDSQSPRAGEVSDAQSTQLHSASLLHDLADCKAGRPTVPSPARRRSRPAACAARPLPSRQQARPAAHPPRQKPSHGTGTPHSCAPVLH